MKELDRKNLWYSLLLAAIMLLLLICYFSLMLPSLYVAYAEEQNLEAIKNQHRTFLETGSYDRVHVKNPTACMSVKIPYEENYLEAASKMLSIKIIPTDTETEELMGDIRSFVRNFDLKDPKAANLQIADKLNGFRMKLEKIFEKKVRLPIRAEICLANPEQGLYREESLRIHAGSGQEMIVETTIFDHNNQYTNYLALERVSDGMVFSILPVVTPQMEQIRPIVMQSVPMLCAVLFMLVLLFSRLYSNGIVHPVYQKLQDVNQSLLEENERQEMFMRATSHQLKTPVTAALLLLDGMIGRIGKYKDRERYLPKVKEQLLFMRRMIEEILSLNKNRSSDPCRMCLYETVMALADSYRVAAAEKQLEITVEGDQETYIWTDSWMLVKIVDNLLSNAVAYTPQAGRIAVRISQQNLMIRNEGVTIPQSLIPHIFEPFVCGEHRQASHGLGLYIAAYYAKIIHAQLNICNRENAVEAVLAFHSKR